MQARHSFWWHLLIDLPILLLAVTKMTTSTVKLLKISDVVQQGSLLNFKLEVPVDNLPKNYATKYLSPEYPVQGIVRVQIQVEFTYSYRSQNYNNQYEYNYVFYLKTEKRNKDLMKINVMFTCKELGVKNKKIETDDGVLHLVHDYKSYGSSGPKFDVSLVVETFDTLSFDSLYDDSELVDFELHGEGGSVQVHKAVLAASSPVFKRMLSIDWKETKTGEVSIHGTTKTTLEHFKNYLYLRKMPEDGFEQLLLLAAYYIMPGLEQKCIEKLMNKLTASNALDLCEFAVKHQMVKLHLTILEYIQSGVISVMDIRVQATKGVAAVCILLEVGALPSRRGGFVCNDPALSFLHVGDTFSISLVAAITVLVPVIIIWTVEATLHQDDEYTLKKNKISGSAKVAGLIYRDYIYGAIVNLTILEVVKCVVGSPRPTFFDLCEPDKAKICNGSEYVSSYACTSRRWSRYLQIDSSRSFPSAHASLSVYCGLFLAWYLQRRVFSWRNRSVLIVPLVQTVCLVYAAVCSLTRVTDHRHHWWDVLVGASTGVLTVFYTVLVLRKNFSQPAVMSTSDLSSSDGNNQQSVRHLLSSRSHVLRP